MLQRREVKYTRDFRRIIAIPRRKVSRADALAWQRVLTEHLRKPGARCELRPWQAYAIAELAEYHGAWLALPVGTGKTLISYLAAIMLKSARTLVIVPGSLEAKTRADFASYIGQWRTPSPPPVIKTWQWLTTHPKFLDTFDPTAIVIDEADDLSNYKASVPRRITRFLKLTDERAAKTGRPRVVVVCLTGTPSRKSILNYWHQLWWCLRERTPMPLTLSEARTWASALDDKGPKGEYLRGTSPGPMGDTRPEALEWFARRLRETPGVVIVDEDSCDQPLEFHVRLAREDAKIDACYERFLKKGENPGGIVVASPLDRWRLDGQMACGYYSFWDPPPPEEWLQYRKVTAKMVRQTIERSQYGATPIETEAQALRTLRGTRVVDEWLDRVRDTYDPEPHVRFKWFSDSCVESVRDWMAEVREPSIIWVGSPELGRRLSRKLGLPYYGAGGVDEATGRGLHEAVVGKSMLVSWNANKKGFNLQKWRAQLIVQPPESAKWIEQMAGRSHRAYQDRAVRIYYLAGSGGVLDGFDKAISEARFSKATVSLTQKVLRARVTRAQPKRTKSNRHRWARGKK